MATYACTLSVRVQCSDENEDEPAHNRITERFDLLFRADFVNAFNSPQFYNGPITDVNNSNFGRIAGAMDQTNLPRFVQLSIKLQF